ncbi:hypothetical protein GOBAR_DD36739 [Gossypium barbadense]|nr:hypothetical protein GOBAR_DD36739 [Gossypium barbadense]
MRGSRKKGPAPVSEQGKTDIVDEAITFFRCNVFFRNFDIKGPADKLLIYLTFYINLSLRKLEGCRTLAEGALFSSTVSTGSRTAEGLSEANKRRDEWETVGCCI